VSKALCTKTSQPAVAIGRRPSRNLASPGNL
jgi:hypothetical protein